MARGVIFGEGHGEVAAASNLATRLWTHLGLSEGVYWPEPKRSPHLNQQAGIEKACRLALLDKADLLLILRDDDDGCPAQSGPQAAQWIRHMGLPFPAAVVLPYREFEIWFLPSIHRMAGKPIPGIGGQRPALRAGTVAPQYPERKRGVKEWLSENYVPPHAYKPTTDQKALTQLIDLDDLITAGTLPVGQPGSVSSAGTLVRALRFLSANLGQAGAAYP
jgi:hypothetical protein